MGVRRLLPAAIAMSMLVAACGEPVPFGDGGDPSTSTTTGPIESPDLGEGIPVPDSAAFHDTVSEFCGGGGDARIEMAFSAAVRARDVSSGVPWVTFDVDAWFTDDLGTAIALWAPGFDGLPGERWLIAASRYSVGGLASGDVYPCASAAESPQLLEEWEATYGGSVTAGGGEPESEPSPDVLAAIAEAEAKWMATAPASYTVTIGRYDRDTGFRECGEGLTRVTVTDGVPTQARDVGLHCDVPLAEAPSIDELFEVARRSAGALEGDIEFDPTYGFIRSFYASDRSVEVSVWVDEFVAGAFPLAEGRVEAWEAARAMWDAAGVDSYTAVVDVRCFCGFQGPVDVFVEDGVIVDASAELPSWMTVTVDGIFDAIRSQIDADDLEMAFHPDLGYPVSARIDPISNAIDDEVDYFILELTPSP